MPFFTYRQNNSGGTFDFDPTAGISTYVVVEARDASHANARAQGIGLYFGGEGDCDCCGDRWYEKSGAGDDTPLVYGEPVETFTEDWHWEEIAGPAIYVHTLDGEITGYCFPPS